jgi:hypothetical protein
VRESKGLIGIECKSCTPVEQDARLQKLCNWMEGMKFPCRCVAAFGICCCLPYVRAAKRTSLPNHVCRQFVSHTWRHQCGAAGVAVILDA